jgi:hypothetical protein
MIFAPGMANGKELPLQASKSGGKENGEPSHCH